MTLCIEIWKDTAVVKKLTDPFHTKILDLSWKDTIMNVEVYRRAEESPLSSHILANFICRPFPESATRETHTLLSATLDERKEKIDTEGHLVVDLVEGPDGYGGQSDGRD